MADERIYLEEHYQQKRLHLTKKLLNLNQGDTKVAAFYDQCACIWRQLDELGAPLSQAEQAQRENNRLRYFLARLRPDFDTVCVKLMEKLTLTTVEVFSVLQEEEARLCKISGEQPSMRVLNDNQYQLHAAVMKDGIELAKQAKDANVKHWACVNFSSIGGEELLRFLHSLSRTCVDIGMHDFKLEPAMMVRMCSPSDADIGHSLWNVHVFFEDNPELRKGQAKFLLVILPDTRCFDEQVEETCKRIGVAYQCCLPLYDKMTNKEYLKNAASEIKAKVIEFSKLSDSRMDTDLDDFGYEEMSEDGYEGDGYEGDGHRGDGYGGHGYIGDGNGEDHNESGDHNPDSSDREMSGKLLFPNEDSTAVTDAILKGKCLSTKTWACVNLSRIRHKRLLRFLSKLGNMLPFGVDVSPEPVLLIHLNSSRDMDISCSLLTVSNFFYKYEVNRSVALLLVILPENINSHVMVKENCECLGLLYHLCPPWRVRRASEKYLKNAANKIKAKVQSPVCSGDMSEDSDPELPSADSDPEELPSSEKDAGEDGSETSDETDEEMGVHYWVHEENTECSP